MISKAEIRAVIGTYKCLFPTDTGYVLDLETLIDRAVDPTSRFEFSGHITCSGLVLTPRGQVILIKHRVLGKWLMPGGHVEAFDASLRDAAIREVGEEVGLSEESLADVLLGGAQCPIEINRHEIQANPRRGEPAHEHWDFRFPFRWRGDAAFVASAEVDGAVEVPLGKISDKLRDRISRLDLVVVT